MKRAASVLASMAVAGAIFGNSVTAVLAATFTYPWFSAVLVNNYDLTAAEMQANYDRVVHFSLFPWVDELQLDTLPMSAFRKPALRRRQADLFQIFVQTGLICLVIALVLGIWLWRRHRSSGFLIAGGIITLATPLLIAIPLIDRLRPLVRRLSRTLLQQRPVDLRSAHRPHHQLPARIAVHAQRVRDSCVDDRPQRHRDRLGPIGRTPSPATSRISAR